MTDKEKIRKEVQRLQNELIQEKKNGFGSDIDDACILELQNVLTFIDSLQEEPVNRTPADIEAAMQEVEEKSMAYTEAHQGEDADTILAQMRGEEPVSEDLEEAAWLYYDKNRLPIPPEWDLHKEFIDFFKAGAQWQKSKDESSTEDLEEVSKKYSSCIYLEEVLSDDDKEVLKARLMNTFKAGAKWQKANLWKLADGDLPEIDREVIALLNNGKVVYAHRPNPDGWDGKNILTGEVRHHDVQTHGKGGWNIPDVKFWLDCELPKIEE